MSIIQNVLSATQAAWLRRWQNQKDVDLIDQSIGQDGFYARDTNDATDLHVVGYDADNQFRIANEVITPTREQVVIHLYPNGKQAKTSFFVNPTPNPIYITGVQCVFTTAGSVAGAAATVTHETQVGGLMQAVATGKAVLSATFDLHGTAETVQAGTLVTNYRLDSRNNSVSMSNPGAGTIVLQPGDSLSFNPSGTLTTLAGVTITLTIAPGAKYHFVSYYAAAAGAASTTSVITALRPGTLLYGAALWQVKEATAATLTLDVTKDASATAPGAGTSMLASTVNLKGTALTYTQLALSATAANLLTAATDSVAVKLSAAPTELAGLLVTLAFAGTQDEIQIDYNAANSTVGTNEEIWVADRDYQVMDFAAKWAVVSTSATIALTADTGTNAPSGGTVLQTDNTNAGFLTSGTVNVPVFATLAATHSLFLRQGDRLGLKNGGTLGTLAGFQLSVRLRPM